MVTLHSFTLQDFPDFSSRVSLEWQDGKQPWYRICNRPCRNCNLIVSFPSIFLMRILLQTSCLAKECGEARLTGVQSEVNFKNFSYTVYRSKISQPASCQLLWEAVPYAWNLFDFFCRIGRKSSSHFLHSESITLPGEECILYVFYIIRIPYLEEYPIP